MAEEVRNLAHRSADSAKSTGEIIEASQKKTVVGAAAAAKGNLPVAKNGAGS